MLLFIYLSLNQLTTPRDDFNKIIQEINTKYRLNNIGKFTHYYDLEDDTQMFHNFFPNHKTDSELYTKFVAFKSAHLKLVQEFYFYWYFKNVSRKNKNYVSVVKSYSKVLELINLVKKDYSKIEENKPIICKIDKMIKTLIESIRNDGFMKDEKELLLTEFFNELSLSDRSANFNQDRLMADFEMSVLFVQCVIENMLERANAYKKYFKGEDCGFIKSCFSCVVD